MECKKPCAKTPPVLQLVNEECPVEFHTVEVEGSAETNPPYVGQYKNTLLVYKEDDSKFLFNSDGVPTNITQVILKGVTDFDELTNRPRYAGEVMTSETDIPNVLEEVAKEAAAREQGDRDTIAAVSNMVNDEETERREADRELQTNIDKKQDALTGPQLAAVNSGIDATKVAQIGTTSTDLSNLSNSVNSLSSSLTAETADRIAADNTIKASVDAEKEAREAADTRLGGRITAEALNRSIADNTITGYIDQYFANSFNMEADANNVTLLGGLLNPVTGATMTVRETLPLATPTTAGIVTAAQHNLIEEARQELIALENGAVAITGLPENPTQAELTTAWESETGYTELMNRASIYDVTNEKVWTYYTNDTTWHMASSATSVEVSPFTNATAGTIKGSTIAGNVAANVDGTGSVSGWTELNNTVAGKANSSDLAQVATSGNYNDLSNKPVVDDAFSDSSTNALQNKVVDAEFDKVAYLGDTVGTPTSLAYVGTTNIQTGAVTTDKISDLNVTTAKIADNAITANKIAAGSITANKLFNETLDLSSISTATGYAFGDGAVARKQGNIIFFEGSIQVPAITAVYNNTVAFTLPAAWRPANASAALNFVQCAMADTTGHVARVRVAPDGQVTIHKIETDIPANAYVQLTGMLFMTS